jgi:hypothetical protein
MKNKNNFVSSLYNISFLRYSLPVILVGIFLLPKIGFMAALSPGQLINLTNSVRKENNLEILSVNSLLAEAAKAKAETIFSTQTFGHNINNKKFSEWIKEAGYSYSYVGENLALDFITSEGVIKAWLDSPTHKKNILNKEFTDIGIAVKEGIFNNRRTDLVVQIFGTPPEKLITRPDQVKEPTSLNNPAKNNLTITVEKTKLITAANKLKIVLPLNLHETPYNLNLSEYSFLPSVLFSDISVINYLPLKYRANKINLSEINYSSFLFKLNAWLDSFKKSFIAVLAPVAVLAKIK